MIIPVRCFTCGKPIAALWETFQERVGKGEKPVEVLEDLGVKRYCCRTVFLTHRDFLRDVARFRA